MFILTPRSTCTAIAAATGLGTNPVGQSRPADRTSLRDDYLTSGNCSTRRRMPSMSTCNEIFTHTDPNLLPVLEELKRREPIFHAREFGTSRADFERTTAPDYWEASASGRRYSREFILNELEKHPPVDVGSVGWQSHDHAVRQLGSDTI
jgi:hypothetical protein